MKKNKKIFLAILAAIFAFGIFDVFSLQEDKDAF